MSAFIAIVGPEESEIQIVSLIKGDGKYESLKDKKTPPMTGTGITFEKRTDAPETTDSWDGAGLDPQDLPPTDVFFALLSDENVTYFTANVGETNTFTPRQKQHTQFSPTTKPLGPAPANSLGFMQPPSRPSALVKDKNAFRWSNVALYSAAALASGLLSSVGSLISSPGDFLSKSQSLLRGLLETTGLATLLGGTPFITTTLSQWVVYITPFLGALTSETIRSHVIRFLNRIIPWPTLPSTAAFVGWKNTLMAQLVIAWNLSTRASKTAMSKLGELTRGVYAAIAKQSSELAGYILEALKKWIYGVENDEPMADVDDSGDDTPPPSPPPPTPPAPRVLDLSDDLQKEITLRKSYQTKLENLRSQRDEELDRARTELRNRESELQQINIVTAEQVDKLKQKLKETNEENSSRMAAAQETFQQRFEALRQKAEEESSFLKTLFDQERLRNENVTTRENSQIEKLNTKYLNLAQEKLDLETKLKSLTKDYQEALTDLSDTRRLSTGELAELKKHFETSSSKLLNSLKLKENELADKKNEYDAALKAQDEEYKRLESANKLEYERRVADLKNLHEQELESIMAEAETRQQDEYNNASHASLEQTAALDRRHAAELELLRTNLEQEHSEETFTILDTLRKNHLQELEELVKSNEIARQKLLDNFSETESKHKESLSILEQTYQQSVSLLQNQKQNLAADLAEAQKKFDALENNLKTGQHSLESTNQSLKAKLEAVEKSYTEAKSNLDENISLKDNLQADITRYEQTIKDDEAKLSSLEHQLSVERSRAGRNSQTIKSLKTQYKKRSSDLEATNELLQNTKSNLAELQEANVLLVDQLSKSQTEHSAAIKKLEDEASQTTDVTVQLDTLRQNYQLETSRIKESYDIQIEKLNANIQLVKERAELEIRTHKDAVQQLKSREETLEGNITSLQKQYELSLEEKEELTASFNNALEEAKRKRDIELNALQTELDQTSTSLATSSRENTDLTTRVQMLEADLESAKQLYETTTGLNQRRAAQKIKRLETLLEKAKDEASETASSEQALKGALARLEEENTSKMEQIDQLELSIQKKEELRQAELEKYKNEHAELTLQLEQAKRPFQIFGALGAMGLISQLTGVFDNKQALDALQSNESLRDTVNDMSQIIAGLFNNDMNTPEFDGAIVRIAEREPVPINTRSAFSPVINYSPDDAAMIAVEEVAPHANTEEAVNRVLETTSYADVLKLPPQPPPDLEPPVIERVAPGADIAEAERERESVLTDFGLDFSSSPQAFTASKIESNKNVKLDQPMDTILTDHFLSKINRQLHTSYKNNNGNRYKFMNQLLEAITNRPSSKKMDIIRNHNALMDLRNWARLRRYASEVPLSNLRTFEMSDDPIKYLTAAEKFFPASEAGNIYTEQMEARIRKEAPESHGLALEDPDLYADVMNGFLEPSDLDSHDRAIYDREIESIQSGSSFINPEVMTGLIDLNDPEINLMLDEMTADPTMSVTDAANLYSRLLTRAVEITRPGDTPYLEAASPINSNLFRTALLTLTGFLMRNVGGPSNNKFIGHGFHQHRRSSSNQHLQQRGIKRKGPQTYNKASDSKRRQ